LNRGGDAARGELLLLLSDLSEPQPGFWEALRAVLAPSHEPSAGAGVGVAGAKVVDQRRRIVHAGMDVALGRPAADTPYEPEAASAHRFSTRSAHHHDAYGDAKQRRDYGYFGWHESDTAVPIHRWQGLPAEPAALPDASWVDGAEEACSEHRTAEHVHVYVPSIPPARHHAIKRARQPASPLARHRATDPPSTDDDRPSTLHPRRLRASGGSSRRRISTPPHAA